MTEDKIEKLLKGGSKLAAIQVLVKEEGFSLKEAKEYVDQYQIEYKIDETEKNQKEDPLKKEFSWFAIFIIYTLVFFIIVFITAHIICTSTKILQGFLGVCFWLFLNGRLIVATFITILYFLWKLIKAPHKLKTIGALFFVTLIFMFIVISENGEEFVKAAKDIVSKPVEVSFADYDVKTVYMTTGRSGSSRICYRLLIEDNEDVDSIIVPLKSAVNIAAKMPLYKPDIETMRKEQGTITVFVYPNTGIVANRKNLEILSENIIY